MSADTIPKRALQGLWLKLDENRNGTIDAGEFGRFMRKAMTGEKTKDMPMGLVQHARDWKPLGGPATDARQEGPDPRLEEELSLSLEADRAAQAAAKMRADAAELQRLLADKEGQLAALREKNQATLDSPKLPPVSARDSNVSRSVPDRFPPSRQPQSARGAGEGTYTDAADTGGGGKRSRMNVGVLKAYGGGGMPGVQRRVRVPATMPSEVSKMSVLPSEGGE